MCVRCVKAGKGLWMTVAGVLILVNVYFLNWEWWTFVGALLIVIGLAKMLTYYCKPEDLPASKKKK
jgi:uncharacterized membrane protein HdeD (DUF308 family)